MSWPAIRWALTQRAPSSPAKFLLVMLADAASVGDWLAWPSVAYLSESTQQDRKTVLKNLGSLQGAGLIQRTAERRGTTGQVIVWRLPVVVDDVPPNKPKSGTASSQGKSPRSPVKQSQISREESQISAEAVPKAGHGTSNGTSQEPGRNRRAARGSRVCPHDFVPTDALIAWAQEKAPGVDIEAETEKFKLYERSKPATDWCRAWQTWMLKAKEFAASRAVKSTRSTSFGVRQSAAGAGPDWARQRDAAVAAYAGPFAAKAGKSFDGLDYGQEVIDV